MQDKNIKKKFKVAVLQPSYKDSTSVIKDLDYARNLKPWLSEEYEVEHVMIDRSRVVNQIRDAKADVYVNLCDGAWDENAPGIDVVFALERFKFAFTGAPSRFYDPTKEAMKKVCYYWNIPTARYYFAYNDEDIAFAARTLNYPLFVKHFHGYNSVGITEKSRVKTEADLYVEAHKMIDAFGGALIEEFIDGREFACLICTNPKNSKEPLLFAPVECVFEPGVNFKTFDYKWNGAKNPWQAVSDPALAAQLQHITRQMFLAMDGEGYARTDIRMDAAGRFYLLEINPNPSIFYPDHDGATADVILMMDGFGKARFLDTLIQNALQRQHRERRNFQVVHDPKRGVHTIAARDIREGELIFEHEEQPHRLVSKAHVTKHWNETFQRFFVDYCWPVSDNVWGMWDHEPESWKPLTHSCDPNCWFEGLNMTARKAIPKGTEITMDYATLYAGSQQLHPIATAKCQCGSHCRGGWQPDDYKQAWFHARYGAHVSDYVRQKQKLHQVMETVLQL